MYCATVDTAIGGIWCLRSHASNRFRHVRIGLKMVTRIECDALERLCGARDRAEISTKAA